MLPRVLARNYTAVTAIFYLLVSTVLWTQPHGAFFTLHSGNTWPSLFALAGTVALMGLPARQYATVRISLLLAAAVALSLSTLFLIEAFQNGQFFLGFVMWSFIGLSHLSVAKMPDPYLIALFEREVQLLGDRVRRGNG